ncbi:MAG TPA: S53 family peptidase [Ktedonobacterales bacterium]
MYRNRRLSMYLPALAVGLVATIAASLGFAARASHAQAATASARSTVGFGPLISVGPLVSHVASQPPTSQDCRNFSGGYVQGCYGPADLAAQYDFNPLYAQGITGQGQTIVIFDSFGSPTIQQDLATFDQAWNLPDPPSFTIYNPEGAVTFNYTKLPSPVDFHNKNVNTELGWAFETTLDVEWAHAMAPGASIALVTVPVSETVGVQGLQNLITAQQWVLEHHIGTIWSNSYGAPEPTFPGSGALSNLNAWYTQAAEEGVSNFFASGDYGATGPNKQFDIYPFANVDYPASSPAVIATGGTEIQTPPLSISAYQAETAWTYAGGGYSAVFPEPGYQSGAGIADAPTTRGVPDVSYNSSCVSAVLIYESFYPHFAPGWLPICGTSAATPQWAAIDALANQADGPLGFLAPRLYQVYRSSAYASAFHDVTTGNNSFAGVTGFAAGPGWDAATGLGTPDVAGLVAALKQTH